MLDREELTADQTDKDGNAERDQDPNHRDTAGTLELVLVADRHEAQQNLRHTEVAQTPCHHRGDGQQTVGQRLAEHRKPLLDELYAGRVNRRVGKTEELEEAGDILCVGDNLTDTAGLDRRDHHDNGQRGDHHDGLHKVGNTFG